MSSHKRFKVLVSAFNFSPVRGSEFAIGWDYVRAIAEHNQVWVITRSMEHDEIENYLKEHPDVLPGVKFLYVPWTFNNFKIPLWEIPYYFYLRRWNRQAYRLAFALDQALDFDLVHHVTGTGFRSVGHLWRLGKPFVWGPVAGLYYFPVRMLNAVPWGSRIFFVAKNVANYAAMRSPRLKKIAQSASLVIAGTSGAAEQIKAIWGVDAPVMQSCNAPECPSEPPQRRLPGQKFRIVWSGHCEPRKAFNIVLLAMAKVKSTFGDWELLCLGDGPLAMKWKKLTRKLDISNHCKFLGRLPRAEAVSVMASGHCLVQPSLYDATTSVVVEALSMGLPVICLDHLGFRDAVDPSCGIRIPVRALNQVVDDFARAIEVLARNEDPRHARALAAREASKHLTWRHKARVLFDSYEQIISACEKPLYQIQPLENPANAC